MYGKAKSEAGIFFAGILALLFGIMTFVFYHDYMMHGKPVNINKLLYEEKNNLDSNEITGEFASITLNSSLGSFATEKHTFYFIPTGESTYYLTLLDDNSIMAVKVKDQKDVDTLEKMTSETYASSNFYSKETITLEGQINTITSGEIKQYYDQALVKLGVKDENGSIPDNKIKMRYICLDATENRGTLWTITILSIVVGGGCIFGDVIVFSIIRKKKKREMEIQERYEAELRRKREKERDDTFWEYSHDSGIASETKDSPEKQAGGLKAGDDYDQEYLQFDELDLFMSDGEFMGENSALDPNREEEPKFNQPERRERTEDNKISISGRDIVR